MATQEKIADLGGGAWAVRKELVGVGRAELHLVFFDAARAELLVVDQPLRSTAVSLGQSMRSIGAIAGCNGGYFTPEFTPLGLLIAQGSRVGRIERSSLLGGVLLVRHGRPVMLWRDEFVEQSGITDLVQAGPRLVNGGLAVKGLEATKRRARTFVLTDCTGHWAFGLCDSISLRDLSDLLATPDVMREFQVERALNLDGGSSSGLWFRHGDGAENYEREFATVRTFLALVPKPQR
ncbi:MAG: phosphodiester glycosidase family protein [Roseimicrobium sp.]